MGQQQNKQTNKPKRQNKTKYSVKTLTLQQTTRCKQENGFISADLIFRVGFHSTVCQTRPTSLWQ